MTDVALVIEGVRRVLRSGGVDWSPREPEWLLEAASGKRLQGEMNNNVSTEVEAKVLELARRRASGEPLQYLTGVAAFRRLELEVGPGALIPRPETELVVERAIDLLRSGGIVVDVGTGSGAIALAIADERPDAKVWATDVSPSALEWARSNAKALELPVSFARGDLLDACPVGLAGRIDVVVANLPYVPTSDGARLPKDVVDHEPHEALFAGPDGLSAIAALARMAPRWLSSKGWLVLEIGHGQGALVRSMLEGLGYIEVSLHRDLSGRERVMEGRSS